MGVKSVELIVVRRDERFDKIIDRLLDLYSKNDGLESRQNLIDY